MFHRLRRTVNDHHIALLEHRAGPWIAPYNTVAPHRVYRGLRAAFLKIRDAAADGPGMRRQDDAMQLLAKSVGRIQMLGAGVPKVLAQHAVTVAASVIHRANHV